jgi:hypothetical protein
MIDWGSNVVNGQLVPQAPTSAFYPLTMGAQFRGPGFSPRMGTWQVPPVVPAPLAGNAPNPGAQDYSYSAMASNPFHPTQGTILFGFGALVLGLFMLRYIHYGKG